MITASVTGLVRTLLIIVGVFVVIRFLGQLMSAKRNIEEERQFKDQQNQFEEAKKKTSKNIGKTRIVNRTDSGNVEDVDFEEVD